MYGGVNESRGVDDGWDGVGKVVRMGGGGGGGGGGCVFFFKQKTAYEIHR